MAVKFYTKHSSDSLRTAFHNDWVVMNFSFIGFAFDTLRPRQNGRPFADDIFEQIFVKENVWISLKISLKFVPNFWIQDIQALAKIMACHWPGNKPLSEPMMVSLLTHIWVTRPQWVKIIFQCVIYRWWYDASRMKQFETDLFKQDKNLLREKNLHVTEIFVFIGLWSWIYSNLI